MTPDRHIRSSSTSPPAIDVQRQRGTTPAVPCSSSRRAHQVASPASGTARQTGQLGTSTAVPAAATATLDEPHVAGPRARRLRVLDLFSGLGGWSRPMAGRGHDVRTLDIDPRFGATYCLDIQAFADDPEEILGDWRPDLVTASPDCAGFATIARAWKRASPQRKDPRRLPVTEAAHNSVRLVQVTLQVLDVLQPRFFVIENPCGMLRKTGLLSHLPRRTVDYCQYGLPYQKPTDLWHQLPATWLPRPRCPAFRTRQKEPCPVHQPGGLLSVSNSAERALVPDQLALDIVRCIETYLEASP